MSNEWFSRADVDRSMYLEAEELGSLMADVGLPLKGKEVQTFFDHFDKKGAGSISYSEFTQTLRGDMPQFAASLAFMNQYRGHYPSAMVSVGLWRGREQQHKHRRRR